jgi:hypothetical protein
MKRAGLALAGLLLSAALAGADTVRVVAERGANLREARSRTATVVDRLPKGATLEVIDREGEWFEVVVPATGGVAYVHESVVEVVPDPTSPITAPPPAEPAAPSSEEPEAPEIDSPPRAEQAARSPEGATRRPAGRPGLRSRLSLWLGGNLAATGSDFEGRRTFTQFAEEGQVNADYSPRLGGGAEVGLEYALRPRLSLEARFAALGRGHSARYTARLPHPLYLERHREVTGELDGGGGSEFQVHLGLLYHRAAGRWRYGVFGGPSWLRARADLLEPPAFTQEYPYDTVTVTLVPRRPASGSGLGFNLGASADYRVRPRWSATARLSYARAGVGLPQPSGEVSLTAGGMQLGVGLRWELDGPR